MKFFVAAQPSQPVTRLARVVSLAYAGILTVLALAQLFTFEVFIELIPTLLGSSQQPLVFTVAPLIIVLEIFSLPYLLGMAVSPALRWVSCVFGWLVPIVWLSIGLHAGAAVENTGFLGDIVPTAGLTTASLALLLFAFAAYTHYQRGLSVTKTPKK